MRGPLKSERIIIFQHLLASIVKSRLAACLGDIGSLQGAGTASSGRTVTVR
ncbi:MAG TPA: hypothetical protein VKL40_01215 [Candidatus Angelobacter sp.]|nr:hypothetical protein [Candidatus Angelobacter sp.]